MDLNSYSELEPLDYQLPELGPTSHELLPPPPPILDDEALVAEYFCLAHLYNNAAAAATEDHGRAFVPLPHPLPAPPTLQQEPPNSGAVVAHKKRKHRSGEMVRASSIALHDQQQLRDLVRRTRITYESLRALIIHDYDVEI